MNTSPMQTITTEADVPMVRRHWLNPARRLLRMPLPMYVTPLFAEAVVAASDSGQLPLLRITHDGKGRAAVRIVYAVGTGPVFVSRMTLRERGTSGRSVPAMVTQLDRVQQGLEDAGEQAGGVIAGFVAGVQRGFQVGTTGPAETALPDRVAAMLAEATTAPVSAVDAPPPTESTSVLHDLRFIAEALEVAQFEVALSPGGPGAGSVDNHAHLALLAVQMVQGKLDVVADAADLALGDVGTAQTLLASVGIASRVSGEALGESKSNLNRAMAMLRLITGPLPVTGPTKEPTHVKF